MARKRRLITGVLCLLGGVAAWLAAERVELKELGSGRFLWSEMVGERADGSLMLVDWDAPEDPGVRVVGVIECESVLNLAGRPFPMWASVQSAGRLRQSEPMSRVPGNAEIASLARAAVARRETPREFALIGREQFLASFGGKAVAAPLWSGILGGALRLVALGLGGPGIVLLGLGLRSGPAAVRAMRA